jgi:spore coat polysaccharide biosynthesis predicted glycosyltransferase SpsG
MRIVIRVIASKEVGLGHVYRALTLAEEFGELGHKVIFLCDSSDFALVESLVGDQYVCIGTTDWPDDIVRLEPDLVINDVLDTKWRDTSLCRVGGAKVVNFEDLGKGSENADLVINALFQEPQREGDHYLWGIDNFFLRDEFVQARQAPWNNRVDNVLITFGGTDPTDLTWKTVNAIAPYCYEHKVTMYIIVGPGYDAEHEAQVMKLLWDWGMERVWFIRETGVMAQVMSRCQLAFCSNGRTVYELAHMHVPAIVTAHSERENTHDFACAENGFSNLGVYREGVMYRIRNNFLHYLDDLRRYHWDAMQRFDLSGNKARVAKRILEVVDG